MKRLVLLALGAPLELTPVGDLTGPFPYVLEFGDRREAARAGHLSGLGVGESPSQDVTLANPRGVVADLIGRPLRASALIYDDDTLDFAGLVSQVVYGRQIVITIES